MKMRKQCAGVGFLLLAGLALVPARAEEAPKKLPASIQKRLESFDPEAVAAARHYMMSPLRRASLAAMLPKMTEAMAVALDHANPGLSPEKRRLAIAAAQEAVTARLDLMIDMSMVSTLEVFSKDEIIAIDQFYSSPVGQSVMTKMPKVMERMPAMMQVLMPLIAEDFRGKIKAKGLDLQL